MQIVPITESENYCRFLQFSSKFQEFLSDGLCPEGEVTVILLDPLLGDLRGGCPELFSELHLMSHSSMKHIMSVYKNEKALVTVPVPQYEQGSVFVQIRSIRQQIVGVITK